MHVRVHGLDAAKCNVTPKSLRLDNFLLACIVYIYIYRFSVFTCEAGERLRYRR